jgi:leucine efflux protein
MTVASRWGVAAGYRGACGIFLGDLILMILSATGAASLLQATPALFMGLRYGAAYLVWLGIGLLRAGLRPGGARPTRRRPWNRRGMHLIPSGWRCSSA